MSLCRKAAFLAAAVALSALTVVSKGEAQDLEPRAYANTPVDLNFAIAGYGYTWGGVAFDPALPLEDAEIEIHSALFAYARSFSVWGKSAKVDVIVPYAWLSGSAKLQGQPQERHVDGFADPRFRFSINLYGAPAMSLAEYPNYHQNIIVGASIQVSPPLGQYDSEKIVNLGTNRWSVKPELGISKAWGPLTVELASGITFYSDNDDFFGGMKREQEPIYSAQVHLIYAIGWGIWCAFDATFYGGGETTLEGVGKDDRLQNARVGGTLALPVNRYNSIKIAGSSGATSRIGSDFNSVVVAWQLRWGGGL